jgi:hypothetical protein
LTDLKGTVINNGSFESGMTIDLAEFPAGVYSLNVFYQDGTIAKRIVKQ